VGTGWIEMAQVRAQWRGISQLVETQIAYQEGLCSAQLNTK